MLVTIEMDLQATEVRRELLKSLSGHITVHRIMLAVPTTTNLTVEKEEIVIMVGAITTSIQINKRVVTPTPDTLSSMARTISINST